MGKIVGIRFRECGKIYHFDNDDLDVDIGNMVIVDTEQGQGLGEVVSRPRPIGPTDISALKKILRVANEDDLWQHEKNLAREKFAFEFCLERIKARQMEMKLVATEALFDGSKIIFFYTADGRVDFRALVKDLVSKFRTRIEMRQIGVRHEAKMVGGLGCCGRELCCATFLSEFAPVSVKMAKEQNLSLNPTKISGLCGRLMCCLTFEYRTYQEHRKGLPKLGKKVATEKGEGKVIRQNIIERISTVLLSGGEEWDIEHGPLPESRAGWDRTTGPETAEALEANDVIEANGDPEAPDDDENSQEPNGSEDDQGPEPEDIPESDLPDDPDDPEIENEEN